MQVTDGADQNSDDDMDAVDDTINVTVTVTNVNEAPVITGDASPSIAENESTPVATYTGADPERDTLTWSVNNDNDFWISDRGQLYFRTPPSFEGRPSYQVAVTATDDDETSPLSGSFDATVTVTDAEEEGTVVITPPRGWVDVPTRFSSRLDRRRRRTSTGISLAVGAVIRTAGAAGQTSADATSISVHSHCYDDAIDQYLRATASYDRQQGQQQDGFRGAHADGRRIQAGDE